MNNDMPVMIDVRRPNYLVYMIGTLINLYGGVIEVPGKGPRVVAINEAGREWTLSGYATIREADAAALDEIDEIKRVGYDVWTEANDIPEDFLDW
jgi:hypothetical protein